MTTSDSMPAVATPGHPAQWARLAALGVVFGDLGTSPLYTGCLHSGRWRLFGPGMSGLPNQEVLEPDLLICDPHHHLLDLPDTGISEFLLRMQLKL
jgi:hypothetical protein